MRKYILSLIVLVVLLSCSTNPKRIRVGLIKGSPGEIPFKAALDAGIIEKKDLRLKYYNTENDLAKALKKGRVDVAALPISKIIQEIDAGQDIKAFSSLVKQNEGLVVSKNIYSLKDLAFRKIGVINGSVSDVLLSWFMEQYNLTLDIVKYDDNLKLKMDFENKKIDGITASIPELIKFNPANAYVMFWYRELFTDYPSIDLCASTSTVFQKKALFINLLNNLAKANTYLNNKKPFYFKEMVKSYNIQAANIPLLYDQVRFESKQLIYNMLFVEKVSNVLYKKGLCKKMYKYNQIYYEIKQ